jgi:hypothetical protein
MRVHTQLLAQAEWNDKLRVTDGARVREVAGGLRGSVSGTQGRGALRLGLDELELGGAFATLADGFVWQQSLDTRSDTQPFMQAFMNLVLVAESAKGSKGRAAPKGLRGGADRK